MAALICGKTDKLLGIKSEQETMHYKGPAEALKMALFNCN
jgi:hypothetical protein